MAHGRLSTRLAGLVSLSAAAMTARRAAVWGFVPPAGTSSQSQRLASSPARPMSVSAPFPEDGGAYDKAPRSNEPNNAFGDGSDAEPSPLSDADAGQFATDRYDGRDGALPPPDDAAIPATRRLRWEREALVRSKFASDDEVFELRRSAASLREELADVRDRIDDGARSELEIRTARARVAEIESELLALQGRDAEFMYAVSRELAERARGDGDMELAEKYDLRAGEARRCIPQLNMHGLWVGKYGESGYEMVNVTYDGDTLVARKVTGDRNVPKGEVSFTVDLAPLIRPSSSGAASSLAALDPIALHPKARKQWRRKYLPRHAGRGQVAGRNFANAQWVEGQMISVGRFFAFAWVPLGHQVFFGRPSAELIVKMLRDARDDELRSDHMAVMRDVVETMWEETYWEGTEADCRYAEEGCFE